MNTLTETQINERLTNLKDWEYSDKSLRKEFLFEDFKQALNFIVRIGFEAEKQGHHPNLCNVYNKVSIQLNTHDAGDQVTQKDIDLATAIENIF